MRSFVPVQPVRRIAPAVLTLFLSTVATATLCPSVVSAQDGGGRTMRRISIPADTPLAAAL